MAFNEKDWPWRRNRHSWIWNLKQNIQHVSWCTSPMVTYSVDRGPTKVHRFCVCAGQTVSVLVEQQGSRGWVRVEWGGGGGQASSFSATVFWCALFIYLGRRVHPPCRVCYLFSLWVRASIQSTLSAVTVLHRTHTHTLIGTYIAYWDACASPRCLQGLFLQHVHT